MSVIHENRRDSADKMTSKDEGEEDAEGAFPKRFLPFGRRGLQLRTRPYFWTLPINPRNHQKRQEQKPMVADAAVILDIEEREQSKRCREIDEQHGWTFI